MPHKDLEDLTLFPFEKKRRSSPRGPELQVPPGTDERGRRDFSKSRHCGTNVKVLLTYFTTVSTSTARTIITVSKTTTVRTTVILLESL